MALALWQYPRRRSRGRFDCPFGAGPPCPRTRFRRGDYCHGSGLDVSGMLSFLRFSSLSLYLPTLLHRSADNRDVQSETIVAGLHSDTGYRGVSCPCTGVLEERKVDDQTLAPPQGDAILLNGLVRLFSRPCFSLGLTSGSDQLFQPGYPRPVSTLYRPGTSRDQSHRRQASPTEDTQRRVVRSVHHRPP